MEKGDIPARRPQPYEHTMTPKPQSLAILKAGHAGGMLEPVLDGLRLRSCPFGAVDGSVEACCVGSQTMESDRRAASAAERLRQPGIDLRQSRESLSVIFQHLTRSSLTNWPHRSTVTFLRPSRRINTVQTRLECKFCSPQKRWKFAPVAARPSIR